MRIKNQQYKERASKEKRKVKTTITNIIWRKNVREFYDLNTHISLKVKSFKNIFNLVDRFAQSSTSKIQIN